MDSNWQRLARDWDLLGSPLRPGGEDLAFLAGEPRAGRTLLLGVTPEVAALGWERLIAVDRSRAMLGAVWRAPPRAHAAEAEWLALPFPAGSFERVLGDGCLTVIAPAQAAALFEELHRVLAPGGRVLLRIFARPAPPETLAQIRAALDAGEIGSVNVFKWRVAMALAGAEGERLDALYAGMRAVCPSLDSLAGRFGWPRASVRTMEAWRGSQAAYAFPTLDEVQAIAAGRFSLDWVRTPSYELGDRCPTLSFTAR